MRSPEAAREVVLAAALTDLAAAVLFPPTPRLADSVVAELRQPARGGWWPRPASVGRALVLGSAAAVLAVGVVGAIGIGLGAIRINFADGTPLPTPVGSVPNRGFGQPITLDEAQVAVPFDIRLPDDPELGDPDEVYLSPVPAGGTVTLIWGDRPSFPANEEGIGLAITEFSADIGPETFEKMILEGTSVAKVTVNGTPGWWVEGGMHAFFYRDATGEIVDTTLRLVGSTLLWEEEGVVYRVEGAPSLGAAQEVAGSLR
ncbi:MAG: hypothetical protein EHM90_05995 [Chloroflexi bacterium]|nr:MAG: hypothetical protein EHM90_05995 [Chloroflexota bacterium]